MLYALPVFARGFGFGNRLFPWARARVFCAVNGGRMLAPRWVRFAVGSLLRGGIDARAWRRQFLLQGLFHPREGDVTGLARTLVRWRTPRAQEPEDPRRPLDPPPEPGRDLLVPFPGYRGFFRPLLGWEATLLDELRAIARPEHLAAVDRFPSVPVAMNVRCGHECPDPQPGARRIEVGQKTPLPWFRDALRAVRAAAGWAAPAYVVSDGTERQLETLLAEEAVTLVRPGCAISDLLTLARARVLLASGSSSFSAWGSFLGGMPTASHPGQPSSAWRLPDGEGGPPRREFDPLEPDPRFLASAKASLGGAPRHSAYGPWTVTQSAPSA